LEIIHLTRVDELEHIRREPKGQTTICLEEIPMTMQVGMIGSNGIVLASDTRHSVNPLVSDGGVRHHYGAPKIKIDPTEQLAVACAGDMPTANQIASRVMDELMAVDPFNRERRIWEIGREVAGSHDAQCLIAYPDSRLYFFQSTNSGSDVSCTEVWDSIHAGDSINAATFWTTRYYRKLPIKRLLRLAAFLIFEAHKLASGGINGLEMVYWNGAKYLHLSKDENRKWEAKAKQWDKQIRRFILGYGDDAGL
jgi:20S proteasome alpha/beta subunit